MQMVKRALLILIFFLAGTALAGAAPSGGTLLPAMGEVEVGYEYNAMFRRDLARSYGVLQTQDHFFIASVGLFDWLSLDGKVRVNAEARFFDENAFSTAVAYLF